MHFCIVAITRDGGGRHWSSGYDSSLPRMRPGFDFRMTHILLFTIKHSISYLRPYYAFLAVVDIPFTHASTTGRRTPITCFMVSK